MSTMDVIEVLEYYAQKHGLNSKASLLLREINEKEIRNFYSQPVKINWKLFWERFKGGDINRTIPTDTKEVIEGLVVRAIRGDL